MRTELLHLKDDYPALGTGACDPVLELFLPHNTSEMQWDDKKRPCLLICPGGGYASCSQRESEPIALHFLTAGCNVFVLTYSVYPHRYPTQLREIAAALDLIGRHAEDWHCDTGRIAIMGFSAGGHLAAHYANRYDCPAVREMFPHSRPVQACILGYPLITTEARWTHKDSFARLLGEYPEDEAAQSVFSCDKMVTEKTPPTFLWHTSPDGSVPIMNSLLYASALACHQVPFEMHVYPRGKHGLATADLHSCRPEDLQDGASIAHEWLSAARRWLSLVFG